MRQAAVRDERAEDRGEQALQGAPARLDAEGVGDLE